MRFNLFLHTDGGSRGNPGPGAYGYVVLKMKEPVEVDVSGKNIDLSTVDYSTPLVSAGQYLGKTTNNEAEYQGIINGLQFLNNQYFADKSMNKDIAILILLDSKLVVEQINRHWKIKEERLRLLADKVWQQLDKLPIPYVIKHIPREQNSLADKQVNVAMEDAGF